MLFVVSILTGCTQPPPELPKGPHYEAGQVSHMVYLGYVDRDFLVDAAGESDLAACEAALEPEGEVGCRFRVGDCMEVVVDPAGRHMLSVAPSKCPKPTVLLPPADD